MGGIDMKTIEERAKLRSEYYDEDDGYSAGVYVGYIDGATEQKAIDDAECVNQFLMGKGGAINYYKQGFHDAIEKACGILEDMTEGRLGKRFISEFKNKLKYGVLERH